MLAQTPPMGWNSWNTFAHNIDENLIKEMADFMVSEGYLDAGYDYLVIDDCWAEKQRDENGNLVPSHEKFPSGIKAVADYVHSKGLKFGIYSCAGVRTCAGYPGSFGHEYQDAKLFAEWGVDFLKYDFCNFPANADNQLSYATMSMALKASGREILFSACNWGTGDPWAWMRSVGVHMYRSTRDILDNFVSFIDIAESQIPNLSMSAPGCFNDPDMLIVGMHGKGHVGVEDGCTDEEYKTHFALWAMFHAPLMIGADLRKLSPENKALLLNKDLIAINQDPEGRPPHVINNLYWNTGRTYIFWKHLANNEFAIGMFNFSDVDKEITANFANAGLPYYTGIGLKLKDVFTGEDLGVVKDSYTKKIPAHGCAILKGTFAF